MSKVRVIVNPAAGAGKTQARLPRILEALDRQFGMPYTVSVTKRQLDATIMTSQAILEGAELVIAVGGDGTINEVVNGFFEGDTLINPSCKLGLIRSGSGGDFVLNMGLPTDLSLQAKMLSNGSMKRIDVGRMTFRATDGSMKSRYVVNECGAGISGVVVRQFERRYKKLGGRIGFAVSTLLHGIPLADMSMKVTIDGSKTFEGKFLGVIVTNGASIGGGMRVTPSAKVDDGTFNILLIHELPFLRRLRAFSRLYSGTHIPSEGFTHLTGTHFKIESDEKVYFEADGEFLGTLPAEISVKPGLIPAVG